MIKFLRNKFEINKPQLIISVTGGSKNFILPQMMKDAFKKGLTKSSRQY